MIFAILCAAAKKPAKTSNNISTRLPTSNAASARMKKPLQLYPTPPAADVEETLRQMKDLGVDVVVEDK